METEITVLNSDGLGNRYFKLAFLYAFCKKNGYKPVVYMNLTEPNETINGFLNGFWAPIQKKGILQKQTIIEELPNEPCVYREYKLPKLENTIVFKGFFQSEKYFKEYSKDIKKFIWGGRDFSFLDKKYPDIQNCYFIHVRGGDFLSLEHANPNIEYYYDNCIKQIGEDKKFVIFTNDEVYCKNMLGSKFPVINENEINSLYLMSRCLGGICANSTFSWWGAWLNENPNKQIFMPKEWFHGKKFEGFKWDDIYFENVNVVSVNEIYGDHKVAKQPQPLLTIITPTIGNEEYLIRNIKSVQNQSSKSFKHLIVVDGPQYEEKVRKVLKNVETIVETNVMVLPENTGANGWICHRIYGGIPFLVNTEYVSFLDEDNFLESNHVLTVLETMKNKAFCFTHRNIVNKKGEFICRDECESMGDTRSVWNSPGLNFVDTNCFTFRTELAVKLSQFWYAKARQPGKEDADRVVSRVLFSPQNKSLAHASTGVYTLNYMVENREDSVKKEYFLAGNEFIKKN